MLLPLLQGAKRRKIPFKQYVALYVTATTLCTHCFLIDCRKFESLPAVLSRYSTGYCQWYRCMVLVYRGDQLNFVNFRWHYNSVHLVLRIFNVDTFSGLRFYITLFLGHLYFSGVNYRVCVDSSKLC